MLYPITLMFSVVLIKLLMNFRRDVMLLLALSVAVSIHGMSHQGLELRYGYYPLGGIEVGIRNKAVTNIVKLKQLFSYVKYGIKVNQNVSHN